ncbi:translation initiation factor IF-2-like [Phyllostomus hastatus]|uniref:translation initiation factor IF-2-like n=1 Tax=Phyllostomus hastatus TaxID=9423 RepID=UPI001E683F32|nr:translation initiation factor IF-2-like [Phyllostomus hastatus]
MELQAEGRGAAGVGRGKPLHADRRGEGAAPEPPQEQEEAGALAPGRPLLARAPHPGWPGPNPPATPVPRARGRDSERHLPGRPGPRARRWQRSQVHVRPADCPRSGGGRAGPGHEGSHPGGHRRARPQSAGGRRCGHPGLATPTFCTVAALEVSGLRGRWAGSQRRRLSWQQRGDVSGEPPPAVGPDLRTWCVEEAAAPGVLAGLLLHPGAPGTWREDLEMEAGGRAQGWQERRMELGFEASDAGPGSSPAEARIPGAHAGLAWGTVPWPVGALPQGVGRGC